MAAIVAIVAGASLLYGYAIEPLATRWIELHDRARKAESELAQLQDLIEHRDAIEREHARLKNAVTTGASEQELQVSLFNEVDKLARDCGLELSAVRPLAAKKETGFSRYGLELQVHCEGHELVKLLQRMQDQEHLLHIDHLSMAVGPGTPPITVTVKASKLARVEG